MADETICTAIDRDWGDEAPNLLMHPPCVCPRCAPEEVEEPDDHSWLHLPGQPNRLRVEVTALGEMGHATLG